MIDAIPDPIFVKDREHRWVRMNQAFCDLVGQSREVLSGKSDYDFLPREQADEFWEKDALVFESGESNLNEESITSADGTIHHLQTRKSCFEADSGHFLVGIIRDISERKRMEMALARRENEFRTLVENTPDTIARYDTECRRSYVNPAFSGMVEGGAEALLGRTPVECPGGVDSLLYEARLSEVMATGQPLEFEMKWDSSEREVCSLISLTPEFGADGQVASVLAVGRDISELHQFRQKVHQMAFYDPLTKLPNRSLFNDRLRQVINDAEWHGHIAGVMMIDMDRFKQVNDTLSHAVGDEVLREAATRIGDSVRGYDTVARLGGDEFAVVVPELRSADDLGKVASKVLAAFDEPFMLNGTEVVISCSIGLSIYPGDGTEPHDLLKFADAAMYYAKRSGRNLFRFYSRDLTDSSNERLTLEGDLRRAIERGELELYYQPKIDLSDEKLLGCEALLRWHHPRFGMVPPDKFIGIAEDSGQIAEIGEWVLREACRAVVAWNRDGVHTHKVAVNLSVRQFQVPDLYEQVSGIMDEYGCRSEWLELEITESLLLEETGDVCETLQRFRERGITIAIDDFGTGYSALSYLARFPINTLKIDRSFTAQVTDSDYHAEVVKAILSIAQSLGQEVVAEGVETADQVLFLQQFGCHVAQGYFYGKPMSQREFESMLNTQELTLLDGIALQ